MSDEPDPEYGLLLPFVVCRSQGGPYDDDSFVAGYELGRTAAQLPIYDALEISSWGTRIRTASLPQLELIAMNWGWTIRTGWEHDGWTDVDLERVDDE